MDLIDKNTFESMDVETYKSIWDRGIYYCNDDDDGSVDNDDQQSITIKKQGDTSFTCLPHSVRNYFCFNNDDQNDGGDDRAAASSLRGIVEGIVPEILFKSGGIARS